MENLFRYLRGGIIGMCFEYLYRVEYNQITLFIAIILMIHMLIDLDKENRLNDIFIYIFIYIVLTYIWLSEKIRK